MVSFFPGISLPGKGARGMLESEKNFFALFNLLRGE